MFGAIIGDIVGSVYEFNNHKSKDFPLFSAGCFPTDDTFMTIAIGKAIMETKGTGLPVQAEKYMQAIGRCFPSCGFGGRFYDWIFSDNPKPYNSWGNGAAMRVSACGWAAESLDEARKLADKVTCVSHNHAEGFRGAEAVACAIYLARTGKSIDEIRSYIEDHYYGLSFTLDQIRPTYQFDESCQKTVPQAIRAFIESTSFEDAIRNAISIGGDSDTIAAITGSIAEAYYEIPDQIFHDCIHAYICGLDTYPSYAFEPGMIALGWALAFREKYC